MARDYFWRAMGIIEVRGGHTRCSSTRAAMARSIEGFPRGLSREREAEEGGGETWWSGVGAFGRMKSVLLGAASGMAHRGSPRLFLPRLVNCRGVSLAVIMTATPGLGSTCFVPGIKSGNSGNPLLWCRQAPNICLRGSINKHPNPRLPLTTPFALAFCPFSLPTLFVASINLGPP